MLIRALLFSKVETIPGTSAKKKKGKKRKKACTSSKVLEGFTLVNSFLKRDESFSFLKPVAGVDEVNYPLGTKFEMVEICVDFLTSLDGSDQESSSIRVQKPDLDFVRNLLPDSTEIDCIEFEPPAEDLVFCGRNLSVIEKLLQSGATISYRQGAKTSTLAHYAALRKSTTLIPVLQRCGADLNAVDFHGRTPLNIAVANDHLEMVVALLNNGANPNKPVEDGSTALHQAAGRKCFSTVVALLENGADVNAINEKNQTPLDFASEIDNNEDIISILLKNGVDFRSAATSPAFLLRAVRNNAFEFVQKLLEHGARINQTHFPKEKRLLSISDGNEIASIHVACAYADAKMVRLLLDHGADPKVKSDARAPITIAVDRGSKSIVRLLLRNGVTVYDRPDLLVSAAKNPPLMEILLKNGCDVNLAYHDDDEAENEVKIKAVVAAHKTDDVEAIEMLMQYGASFDICDLQNVFGGSYSMFGVFKSLLAYGFTDLEKNDEILLALFRNIGFNPFLEFDHFVDDDDDSVETLTKKLHAFDMAFHLVKLKVAGKQIDESIIPPELSDTLSDIRELAESEIELLKRKLIFETPISFYDLLMKDMNSVSRYFKNEKIRQLLIDYPFQEEFPQYGRIIQFRVQQAIRRREFLRKGMKSFNWLVIRLPRLLPELKEDILSLLTIQDLIKLHLCFPEK